MTPSFRKPPARNSGSPFDIEWIGGTAVMPAYITGEGEGEPYRPEALFWMSADGAILGSTIARPGELLSQASESLQSAIEQPMFGSPHSPSRVRVASAKLADALRAGHPEIDVVCGPTPELDEMLAMMRESMGDVGEGEQSYLSPGVTPDTMASFFEAAAALFRVKPWRLVPSDQNVFSVTIEKFGIRDAVLSIIGQVGQNFGFILFSDFDGFEAYLDAAGALELGQMPELPSHIVLSFERGAEIAPELRKEISEYRWEVATANAYPWLAIIDPDVIARQPTGKEVAMAEAIARALTNVMAEKKALKQAWEGGEPLSRTLSVTTHVGAIDVTLRAPYLLSPAASAPSGNILAELAAIPRDEGELDFDARRKLEGDLLQRFAAAPEAKRFEEIHHCRLVMDLAASYCGHTIATLRAKDLRAVLFVIFPRKVSIDASEAQRIIEETRAFYTYLKREFGLKQADACLRVLGGKATQQLEEALSDSNNFGMAKSLFMTGAKKDKRKAAAKAPKRNR